MATGINDGGIAARYDADKSGDLSPEETFQYLQLVHPDWPLDRLNAESWKGLSAGDVSSDTVRGKASARDQDVSWLDDIIDPGKGDRNAAMSEQDRAQETWKNLGREAPTAEDLTLDPNSIKQYEVGDPLDYSAASDLLYDPGDQASAYDKLQYKSSPYSQDALDYYGGIVQNGGHDAVSDAAYEARRGDAQQAARAQRESAMQNLQERGLGSGGGALMAEMSASRGLSHDAYGAALDAEALAQARRDKAADSMGALGQRASDAENSFGMNRAAGQDSWQNVLGGWKSSLGKDRARLSSEATNANWGRGNTARDTNTDNQNKAIFRNADIPQQVFGNKQAVTAGKTGQNNTATDLYLKTAAATPSVPGAVAGFVGNGLDTLGKATSLSGDDDDEEGKRR